MIESTWRRPVAGPLTVRIGDRWMPANCIVVPAGTDALVADGKPRSRNLRRPADRRRCTLSMAGDSEGFMSASTATTPARPALDGNGSFESPRVWADEDGSPNDRVLADVVQRIVRAVDPDRIVLFGSGARGTMKAGSDLDLLIIKAGCNSRELAARAQCNLVADGPRSTSSRPPPSRPRSTGTV